MNRRQIQHVEAHRGHVRQPGFNVLQRAVPRRTLWVVPRRAGKHFIPCAERGFGTFDSNGEFRRPSEFRVGSVALEKDLRKFAILNNRWSLIAAGILPQPVSEYFKLFAAIATSGGRSSLVEQISRRSTNRRQYPGLPRFAW